MTIWSGKSPLTPSSRRTLVVKVIHFENVSIIILPLGKKKKKIVCLTFKLLNYFILFYFIYFFAYFSPQFFMKLLVKIYMKRHDRHKNTLNNRLVQLFFLSCILFIQKSSSIFHTGKSCDRLKVDTSAAQKKEQKGGGPSKNKTKQKNILVRSTNLSQALRHYFFFSLIYKIKGNFITAEL